MSRKPSTEEAPPAEEEAAGAPAGVELEEALLSEGEVAPEVAKPAEEAPPAEVEAEAETATAVVDGAALQLRRWQTSGQASGIQAPSRGTSSSSTFKRKKEEERQDHATDAGGRGPDLVGLSARERDLVFSYE